MSDELQNTPLEEEAYEPDLITLEDEDGEEHTFEVLDAADIEDMRYLALVPYSTDPTQQLEEDAELLLMRVGEDDGEEYLDVVDDREELLRVGQVFLDRLSEIYDIDLEDMLYQLDDDADEDADEDEEEQED